MATYNGNKPSIVIDGANVAFWYGKQNKFSCRGILLCLAYFKKRKHSSYVFLPQKWKTLNETGRVVDGDVLSQLHQKGIITYVPAGSNDDGFIIQTADNMNALILSNDQYRQEINARPDWYDIVNKRLLSYTFLEDTLCPNPNPAGMSLDVFLTGSHLGLDIIDGDAAQPKKTVSSNDELLKSVLNDENIGGGDLPATTSSLSTNKTKLINNIYHKRNALLTSLNKANVGDDGAETQQRKKTQPKRNDAHSGKKNPDKTVGFSPAGGGVARKRNENEFDAYRNEQSDYGQGQKMTGGKKTVAENVVERPRYQQQRNFENDDYDDTEDVQSCSSYRSYNCGDLPSPSSRKLTYGVGFVSKVDRYDGYIETPGLKGQVQFSLATYNKTVSTSPCVKDLTQIFQVDDEIVFSSGLINSKGVMEASMVCRLKDTVHGYGKLVGAVRDSTAIIHPEKIVNRSPLIETSIFCPGSAFKDGTKLKSMKLEDWVEFYAVEQLTFDNASKFKYIAVKTNALTVEGVFVRIADAYGIVWSRRAGFVFCSKPKANIDECNYKIGQWVACQIRGQSEKNGCKWFATGGRDIRAVVKTRVVNAFNKEMDIEMEVDGFAGYITNTYGSIWCDQLGRITVADAILAKCKSLKLMQRVNVRVVYNAQCHSHVDYVWQATDVQAMGVVDQMMSTPAFNNSFLNNVQLIVEHVQCKNNKPCYAFLKSKEHGDVFARYLDCSTNFGDWKEGDVAYGMIIAQELPNVVWRAFCLDRKPVVERYV